MNPIFIEYYPHEQCDCYKINLPWPKFAMETVVLCPVSKGIQLAKTIATGVLMNHIHNILNIEEKEVTLKERFSHLTSKN